MQTIFHSHNGSSAPEARLVGGKARNLASLTSAGLPVPRWFCLTTAFFERFMGNRIHLVDRLLSSPDENLTELSTTLHALITDTELPADIGAQITQAANSAFGGSLPEYVAVRSSAADEDSKQFSFAGQLESFLFIKPGEGVFEAVKECFASAYSERALAYRRANGIPLEGVRPAVIVQEMVFGDVSGVMFTANPLNNDTDQILINAVYGIGEGIVSGELDSDLWVVGLDDGIEKETLANKREMVVLDRALGHGTCKVAVAEHLRGTACLTNEQVKAVAGWGRKIESLFGSSPQDIEWCIKDGAFHVLQARPVTTMSHIDKSKPRYILDNSNIIESFPGVTSPLTFSFASENYEEVYRLFLSVLGVPDSKVAPYAHMLKTLLCYVDGRIYYNLNSWHFLLQLLPGYSVNRAFMDRMMGVKHATRLEDDAPMSSFRKYFVEMPSVGYSIGKILWSFYRIDEISRAFIKNFFEQTDRYKDEKFEGYSNSDLLKLYDHFNKHVTGDWKAPIINDFYTMIYYGLLGRFIEKMDISDFKSVENDLLCGEGEMESTKPTRAIIELANWIRLDPELGRLFLETPEDVLAPLILDSGDERYREVSDRIRSYISAYGFRCMFELKLEEPSLKEDPRMLFTTIKNYLKKESIDLEEMERREKKIRAAAEALVLPRVKGPQARLFMHVLAKARKAIRNREELRFQRTKIFGIIRSMFNQVGRNLAAQGVIDDPRDVYFLHLDEIRQLTEGRSVIVGIVKDMISLRKVEFEAQKAREAPERMYFFGEMQEKCFLEIATDQDMEYEEDPSGRSFKGVPCSPGEHEGTAKIVLSPFDADLNGEIMLAKRTDPGWVPLFPSVSGIIIERGSVLSHSAVVAREMGIPTIVGLRGITSKIASGERIRMNGATGIVERLDNGDSPETGKE